MTADNSDPVQVQHQSDQRAPQCFVSQAKFAELLRADREHRYRHEGIAAADGKWRWSHENGWIRDTRDFKGPMPT